MKSFTYRLKSISKIIVIFLLLISLALTTNSNPINGKNSLNDDSKIVLDDNDEKRILLDEGFESGTFPPNEWSVLTNNSSYSWHIGNYNKHTGKHSAQCINNPNNLIQNEWIITPSLDFRGYSDIYLYFWWSISYYWAVSPYNYYDLKVQISNDGGINWTEIWTENKLSPFEDWKWYNTSFGNPIDLTEYRDNENILLAIQYYGQNGAQLNIDDIRVYGIDNTNNLMVDIGGPYEAFVGENIYFQANVTGGVKPYKYSWYFGNGETSFIRNAIHKYYDVGEFNVFLNITDFRGNRAYDITKVSILNMSKKPHLVISNVTGSNRINAQIKNIGQTTAENITWKIKIIGGIFNNLIINTSGNCSDMKCNCSINITSETFFSFGFSKINIFAEAENSIRSYKKSFCFIFGNRILFKINIPKI